MTPTEKLALAMAWYDSGSEDRFEFQTLIESLLARPGQEPVAWFSPSGSLYKTRFHATANGEQAVTPLYTSPPQRTEQEPEVDLQTRWPMKNWKENKDTPPQRKPLTDKAITKVIDSMPKKMKGFGVDWDLYEFARAIEAAHGIKETK